MHMGVLALRRLSRQCSQSNGMEGIRLQQYVLETLADAHRLYQNEIEATVNPR